METIEKHNNINIREEITSIWNSMGKGNGVDSIFICKSLEGETYSKYTNKAVHNFLNHMCKFGKSKKIKDENGTYYVKIKNHNPEPKTPVSKNVVSIINELLFNETITLDELKQRYKQKFGKELVNSSAKIILSRIFKSNFLIKKGRSKNAIFIKNNQIPESHPSFLYKKNKKKALKLNLESPSNKKIHRKKFIEKRIVDENIDTSKNLPPGSLKQISEDLGISIMDASKILKTIRNEKGEELESGQVKPVMEAFYNSLSERGFNRGSPFQQLNACNKMIKLLKVLPMTGVGMVIGTPAPESISKNHRFIFDDEKQVANTLDFVTDDDFKPFIIIGNAINKTKANLKEDMWNSFSSTYKYPTLVTQVDKITFAHYVEALMKQNKDKVCKVILLTSGNWTDPKQKHGIDLRFKDPCEDLTNKYPNLHVITMIKSNITGFDVLHLHNGKQNIY